MTPGESCVKRECCFEYLRFRAKWPQFTLQNQLFLWWAREALHWSTVVSAGGGAAWNHSSLLLRLKGERCFRVLLQFPIAINAFEDILVFLLCHSSSCTIVRCRLMLHQPHVSIPALSLGFRALQQVRTSLWTLFFYIYNKLLVLFINSCLWNAMSSSQGTRGASVPWTASHHGPVRVPDEITGAGKCRIRNISDVAILVKL